MPDVASISAVWIVVLQVSAFGFSGTIIADHPKHRITFATEAACNAHVPAVQRDIPIPSMVTLRFAGCRKLELRK
jgi:uncharacterized membrane protein YecN with MAPEG domain